MPAFPRQRFRFHPATGTDGPGRFGVPEAPRSRGRPIIVRRRGPDGGKTSALRAGVPAPEGGVGAGDLHARGTGPQVRVPGAGDPLPGTSGRREAGPTVAEREGLRRRSAPCRRFEPRAPPPGRPAMRPPAPPSRAPPSHDDREPGKPGRFRATLRARRIGHGVTSDRCASPEPGDGPACPPRPAPAPGSRSRGGVPGLHPPNPGKSLR